MPSTETGLIFVMKRNTGEKNRKRYAIGFWLMLSAMVFAGCGRSKQQIFTVSRPSYEKISYQTAEVKRGDLQADTTIRVTAEGYEELVYCAPGESFELDEVHVSVGDRVKKGDVLVSFESQELEQKITAYEDDIKQKELLLQHYERLEEAGGKEDYELDIEMLREDIRVAQLYIEEANKVLAEYYIIAEADGIVTDISEYLENGVISPGVELLTQVGGTGRYLAVSTKADLFAVGDVYTINDQGIEYQLRLEEKEDNALIFQLPSGQALFSDKESYELALEMQEQRDVVYVNRHAVCIIEDEDGEKHCVYVMGDNGYQRAVYVKVGERIGDNMIITEGLSGGEKVVIR